MNPSRHRQYTLRTLLIGVLLISITMGTLSYLKRRQRLVNELRGVSVSISYAWPFVFEGDWRGSGMQPHPPKTNQWLGKILGDDFFSEGPKFVSFTRARRDVTDRDLARMKLFDLEYLRLYRGPNILINGVSEYGLRQVAQYESLRYLNVAGCQNVSCAVLEEWAKCLRKLEELDLRNTNVDDQMLKAVAQFERLESLCLGGTNISDRGLRCLKHMYTLKYLSVRDTKVSKLGVLSLESKLRGTEISFDRSD